MKFLIYLQISPIYSTEDSITSQIAGLTLSNGESGTELYLAKTDKQTDQITTFGTYRIKWKRLVLEINEVNNLIIFIID